MRLSQDGAQPQLHSRNATLSSGNRSSTPPTMMSTMVTICPVTWLQMWRMRRLFWPKRSMCG